jgi:hypothetical protein
LLLLGAHMTWGVFMQFNSISHCLWDNSYHKNHVHSHGTLSNFHIKFSMNCTQAAMWTVLSTGM